MTAEVGRPRLVALTALTVIFDGIDNQILGTAIPAMMETWGATRAAFAPVVAAGLLGMMIGGAAAGVAGDRVGRRAALLGSVALFGLATMAVGAADDVTTLAVLRLVTGAGLGGALPNATALAAEYVRTEQRAIAVTTTIVCVPLGGTLAGLLAIPLLPAIGWRALFVVCGIVPVVVAAILTRVLPESPQYLARREARTPVKAILAADYRVDTIALWGAFSSCLLALYLGVSWLPSVLAGAGFGPAIASSSLTMFNFGGVFGALGGGVLIARFGSRPTMLAMAVGSIAGALALSATAIGSSAAAIVFTLLAVTGGLMNALQTMMYALAAHVYPTAMRATGVGAAVAVGRTGAILGGYAGPAALAYAGSQSFFALMAAALAVTLLSLRAARRHIPARDRAAANSRPAVSP